MVKEYQSEERKGIEKGLGKNTEWTERDLAIKADTPLIDSATGKKLIVRVFDFDWKKRIMKEEIERAKNNKQDFFNSHAKYIRDFLWKDGLSIREDHDPKIIFNNKGYRIAVLCEARWGVSIFDRHTTLQNIFSKKKK